MDLEDLYVKKIFLKKVGCFEFYLVLVEGWRGLFKKDIMVFLDYNFFFYKMRL